MQKSSICDKKINIYTNRPQLLDQYRTTMSQQTTTWHLFDVVLMFVPQSVQPPSASCYYHNQLLGEIARKYNCMRRDCLLKCIWTTRTNASDCCTQIDDLMS